MTNFHTESAVSSRLWKTSKCELNKSLICAEGEEEESVQQSASQSKTRFLQKKTQTA
jgi:hypothetical protein